MTTYIDMKGYEHTKESLIDFMGEKELERRVKMGDLKIKD